jgi:hypothetical protein
VRWIKEKRQSLLWVGMLEAFGVVGLLALIGLYCAHVAGLGYPSAELCYAIAAAGVAILLGYVVESVWMANRAERDDWHENWLGSICGLGLAGLLGVASALAAAARLEAGEGALFDSLSICWSISSLALLGVLVTMHPAIVDRWSHD